MDEDLKLVGDLKAWSAYMDDADVSPAPYDDMGDAVLSIVLDKAAATITRLRAEITQMTNTIDGLEFLNGKLVKERDETSGLLDAMRQRQDGLQLGDVDPAMFELMAEAMDIVALDMGEQMSSEASGQIMCLLAMQMTGAILAVHDEWKKGAE